MPFLESAAVAGKKRKRASDAPQKQKSKKASQISATTDDLQERILALESQILESRQYYNNIAALLSIAKTETPDNEAHALAIVALCRVFCRLMAAGNMVKSKGMPEADAVIVQWLKERYKEYTEMLIALLGDSRAGLQSTVLTLLMRLVKEESIHLRSQGDHVWRTGLFVRLVNALVATGGETGAVIEEFVEKFVRIYDDVRFYTFMAITSIVKETHEDVAQEQLIANSLTILMSVEKIPETKNDLGDFYGEAPEQGKHPLYSPLAHKKQGQEAWLALLRTGLDTGQRKAVLGIMTQRVVPWFVKPETLMDFLTDSYNVGGATSLLALSGLFYLMQEKNLDYPSFYPKLYSLLDSGILHSKHRSRFFRLLDTFMASTHLPAALVASFIKRLSRLALHGPPAGIVVVVPWVYNILKAHPTCTFMIHREIRDPEEREGLEEEGMDDPFDMEEADPMQTRALESSLWEIVTLQSHYHPNVATLAKIISEQFTKRAYSLEDFLDHSYNGIIEAELGKELKKAPVVEFEIPKRILTETDTELNPLGRLLARVIEVDGQ